MSISARWQKNDSFPKKYPVYYFNSEDYFKIKIESKTDELSQEAHEKVQHFSEKFKVKLNKLKNKDTYYIIGFNN